MNHSEVVTKLEEIGIGDADALYHAEAETIGKFVADLTSRAINQLSYDIMTNIPTGIIGREELKGHALRCAIISALGHLHQWDITASIEFAADVLDDVNAHDEAVKVREMAYQDVA